MLSVLGVVGGQATEPDDVARGSAFSIQQQGSTSWLVGPDGRRFFSLFKATLEQAPTSGQRQRLLALLRQTYRNEWSELLRDFEPAPDLRNWEELEQHGVLWLRPGGRGIQVTRRFVTILAERYYSVSVLRRPDFTGGSLVEFQLWPGGDP
jgi:hypothetical protein